MSERVDFYVLKSSTAKQRWTFACRLTEKAYLRNLKVVLLSESDADALDELLWTFNDRAFVPHELRRDSASVPAAGSTPVQLTTDLDSIEAADLLVNLSDRLPARLERFMRIAEIMDGDAERRAKGRERFKTYRDLKLPVQTHQMDESVGP